MSKCPYSTEYLRHALNLQTQQISQVSRLPHYLFRIPQAHFKYGEIVFSVFAPTSRVQRNLLIPDLHLHFGHFNSASWHLLSWSITKICRPVSATVPPYLLLVPLPLYHFSALSFTVLYLIYFNFLQDLLLKLWCFITSWSALSQIIVSQRCLYLSWNMAPKGNLEMLYHRN